MKKSIILVFVILILLVFAVFYYSARTSVTPQKRNVSISSSENISICNETWAKRRTRILSLNGGVSDHNFATSEEMLKKLDLNIFINGSKDNEREEKVNQNKNSLM